MRRFNSYSDYFKLVFGGRVQKISIDIVIERFAGEVPPRFLVSKPWKSLRYDQVLSMIEKRMAERGTWQGRKSGNQVDR